MKISFRNPEILFTVAMVVIMLLLSAALSLPILLPSIERAEFVGIHYLYPLIGIGVWAVFASIGRRKALPHTFLIAFPCYALVQWAYFNIKLWMPYINPVSFDQIYWEIDQHCRPLVEMTFYIRRATAWLIPLNGNFYIVGFIMMFYVSFCFHALRTPEKFRIVFLSALFFQGLGTLAYIPFPALGPFLFEPGVNEMMTAAQADMLEFHDNIVRQGRGWLGVNGPANMTAGLAAMPSLHAGGSFLFFLLAWRHARILLPLYTPLMFYILVAAVATRWHYLIDLPVGMILARVSVALAEKFGGDAPATEAGLAEGALQVALATT